MQEARGSGRKPARKQQQRSIRTRQKLLDAALQAFSENGFKGTSTRDIADRAGVHHPLITYHFKNKEELWRAAADKVFSEFTALLLQARQQAADFEPRERMAEMIRAYVRYASRKPALHKLMLQESSQSSPRLDWLVRMHLKPLYEVVVRELETLQTMGIAPPGDPALLFNLIRVSSGGMIALALEIRDTSGLDLEEPDKVESLADMIVDLFLPGRDGAAAAAARAG
ncbi:MAG: TetR/AcrR family transcriptional regulator [Gammaproteobacteria bacterium]|nr:TetR/AcrR family transcriptional regulator [Gammaproteobacteria bacterium]MDH4253030.1 TetR/AcrR family transcriptional regulator [Gammaproteobacteria bacterium]MDH5308548.1 TetR/AcrR family transcriptional regulator [Gammaproteobacteria bacterium]